jgi:molybdate transport system ATP-binding protein
MFAGRRISGKFRFVGEIVRMQKSDVVVAVTILIGNHTVQVIATESEAAQFSVGERVIVFSKAFHPVLLKA